MAAYSKDLRERVIRGRERGEDSLELSKKYDVSRSWVDNLWKRYRERGSYESLKIGGYKQFILKDKEAEIVSLVEATPDLTIKELAGVIGFKG